MNNLITNDMDNLITNDMDLAKNLVELLPNNYSSEYYKWINVCFVLKNISDELFDVFVSFSQKSSKFNYENCKETWHRIKSNKTSGLTIKSLQYWVDNNNPANHSNITISI